MANNHKLTNSEYELLNVLGINNIFKDGLDISKLSKDQLTKIDGFSIGLSIEKENIKKKLKIKYDTKFNELTKYL